jgi:hypothetical protein
MIVLLSASDTFSELVHVTCHDGPTYLLSTKWTATAKVTSMFVVSIP